MQLFEGSHDIVFFYEEVATLVDGNGRSATIGLQSAAQGLALQYSFDQAAVSNSRRLYFPPPRTGQRRSGPGKRPLPPPGARWPDR
ncbi:MAG: hypothetical protein M5U34_12875 [Chloroflexi bacterium]|nr:hypothetical protein [Chloroflexota bacterium]